MCWIVSPHLNCWMKNCLSLVQLWGCAQATLHFPGTSLRCPGTKSFLVHAGTSPSVILQRFSLRQNTVFFHFDVKASTNLRLDSDFEMIIIRRPARSNPNHLIMILPVPDAKTCPTQRHSPQMVENGGCRKDLQPWMRCRCHAPYSRLFCHRPLTNLDPCGDPC